jgi:hypothetical protein
VTASPDQLPQPGRPPLRVGLVLDSVVMPRYMAAILDDLRAEAGVSLVLAVRVTGTRPPRAPLLLSVYRRWDRRHVPADRDPLAPIDCHDRLPRRLLVAPVAVAGSRRRRLPPSTLADIRHANLDVVIQLGGHDVELPGDLARHGVWRLRHGTAGAGLAACLTEVRAGEPVTRAVLEQITSDGSAVLCEGVYATIKGVSQARNAFRPYWGSAAFIARRLRELHANGQVAPHRAPATNAPESPSRPGRPDTAGHVPQAQAREAPAEPLSNANLVSWLAPLAVTKTIRRLTRWPPIAYWKLGVRCVDPLRLSFDARSGPSFTWLDAPAGRFYADPFLVRVGGDRWLFFEDWEYALGRARLSCARIDDRGRLGRVHPVLERPYHLSYPCVFHHRGELYMVPESKGSGAIELYRCRHFPERWELVRPLLTVPAVDTTVWEHDGRIWFFTTLFEKRSGAPELWLFSAASLESPLEPHPASPVSLDVRNARGAGAIVCHEGRFYRPSQDGSREYGYSFSLNEVVALDVLQYAEQLRLTVEPTIAPGLVATHSYSRLDDLEVIDGSEWVSPLDPRVVGSRGAQTDER